MLALWPFPVDRRDAGANFVCLAESPDALSEAPQSTWLTSGTRADGNILLDIRSLRFARNDGLVRYSFVSIAS